ncbi:MAG: hypothetical protein NT094_01665 [Candidatus Staskawiczbacteria bacterium]|nr:hypothetical protein [Candidatus Staskawiczbacteria bacterium]
MKKKIIIIILIIIVIIIIVSIFCFDLYYDVGFFKNDSKIEVVKETNRDLSKVFTIEDYETIISQKYKITCSTDECSFSIPFDSSTIPELDKSRTKIYLMIYSIENNFFSPIFGEIKNENIINFKILDYQAPNPLHFYVVVVYNPNMESVNSD